MLHRSNSHQIQDDLSIQVPSNSWCIWYILFRMRSRISYSSIHHKRHPRSCIRRYHSIQHAVRHHWILHRGPGYTLEKRSIHTRRKQFTRWLWSLGSTSDTRFTEQFVLFQQYFIKKNCLVWYHITTTVQCVWWYLWKIDTAVGVRRFRSLDTTGECEELFDISISPISINKSIREVCNKWSRIKFSPGNIIWSDNTPSTDASTYLSGSTDGLVDGAHPDQVI